ncbi:uncharacterized protein DS421_18g613890 [Arachis hypogaea]|nr:uncharacterized protein DS421_18g613890 [Arachis hypogaea]
MKIFFYFSILLFVLSSDFGNDQLQVIAQANKYCATEVGNIYCLPPAEPDDCSKKCASFVGRSPAIGTCNKFSNECTCVYHPPCKHR